MSGVSIGQLPPWYLRRPYGKALVTKATSGATGAKMVGTHRNGDGGARRM